MCQVPFPHPSGPSFGCSILVNRSADRTKEPVIRCGSLAPSSCATSRDNLGRPSHGDSRPHALNSPQCPPDSSSPSPGPRGPRQSAKLGSPRKQPATPLLYACVPSGPCANLPARETKRAATPPTSGVRHIPAKLRPMRIGLPNSIRDQRSKVCPTSPRSREPRNRDCAGLALRVRVGGLSTSRVESHPPDGGSATTVARGIRVSTAPSQAYLPVCSESRISGMRGWERERLTQQSRCERRRPR